MNEHSEPLAGDLDHTVRARFPIAATQHQQSFDDASREGSFGTA